MEEIVVGGRRFVAAKVAAKRIGYHPDYIGQLCRARTIPCEKVGRAWFVCEEALAAHKLATHHTSTSDDTSKTSSEVYRKRRDDFSLPRRALVAAIADRVRYHPATSKARGTSPLIVAMSEEEPTLPLLKKVKNQHIEDSLCGRMLPESADPTEFSEPQLVEAQSVLVSEGQQTNSRSLHKRLPPPPQPPKAFSSSRRGGKQDWIPLSLHVSWYGLLRRQGVGLALLVVLISMAGIALALGLQREISCYPLTGCESSYVLGW